SFLRPLSFATSAGELGHFGYLQDALSLQFLARRSLDLHLNPSVTNRYVDLWSKLGIAPIPNTGSTYVDWSFVRFRYEGEAKTNSSGIVVLNYYSNRDPREDPNKNHPNSRLHHCLQDIVAAYGKAKQPK